VYLTNVAMSGPSTLNNYIFYVSKFTAVDIIPLELIVSFALSFLIASLKTSCNPTVLNSVNKTFVWYSGN
jgi:hypothetical protein